MIWYASRLRVADSASTQPADSPTILYGLQPLPAYTIHDSRYPEWSAAASRISYASVPLERARCFLKVDRRLGDRRRDAPPHSRQGVMRHLRAPAGNSSM